MPALRCTAVCLSAVVPLAAVGTPALRCTTVPLTAAGTQDLRCTAVSLAAAAATRFSGTAFGLRPALAKSRQNGYADPITQRRCSFYAFVCCYVQMPHQAGVPAAARGTAAAPQGRRPISCPIRPACPSRRDFANARSESEAHSSNSPGKGQKHNYFDINMLEIQGLPGGIDLASPGKLLFTMILIIR